MPSSPLAHLNALGIPYEAVEFPATIEKGVAAVAQALGDRFRPRQVVKCLLFETSTHEVVLVLVGGDQNVVSGQLKKAVGDRNVRMASPERIREVTGGYEVGAIPPFSWQPPGFRTFLERSLMQEPILAVGAGTWGQELVVTPHDLIRAASAIPIDLTGAGS